MRLAGEDLRNSSGELHTHVDHGSRALTAQNFCYTSQGEKELVADLSAALSIPFR